MLARWLLRPTLLAALAIARKRGESVNSLIRKAVAAFVKRDRRR